MVCAVGWCKIRNSECKIMAQQMQKTLIFTEFSRNFSFFATLFALKKRLKMSDLRLVLT